MNCTQSLNLSGLLFVTAFAVMFSSFITPHKKTVIIGTIKKHGREANPKAMQLIQLMTNDTAGITHTSAKAGEQFVLKACLDTPVGLNYSGYGYLFSYFQTIPATDEDTVFITINIPKKYHKIFGRALCPKCGKRDMTIPIHYGYCNWGKRESYHAGCCVQAEEWYCKRDDLKF